MKRQKTILLVPLAALVSALALPSFSQSNGIAQRTAQKRETGVTEASRTHKDALKRLALLAKESKEIDDPAARVRVQARIADALWHRDEPRARQLFSQAFDDAINIWPPARDDRADALWCGQVRSEVIRTVSGHDPAFAARLSARSRDDAACSFGPRERNTYEDARSVMLVQVAFSIAEKDPAGAARLAQESLSGGIVSQLPELVAKLKEANPRLADGLVDAAIEHIRSSDINGLELDSMGREFLGDPEFKGGKAILKEDKKVDRLLATRLLEASLTAIARFVDKLEAKRLVTGTEQSVFSPVATSEEIAGSFYAALTGILPAYDLYDAKDAAAAADFLERIGAGMNPVERSHMYVFYDNGDTPESLMAEAKASSDERTKNELYWLAAQLADGKESLDQVLEIVRKITDDERREDLHDSVIRNRVFKLLDEKRPEEARQLLGQIVRPEQQVRALVDMAQRAAGSGDKAGALQLLYEAADLLTGIGDGQRSAQAQVLMEIARIVAGIDPVRGFKALKAAIDHVNVSGATPVDPRVQGRYTGTVRPTDPLSLFGTDLRAFEVLSRFDYFQALKLAQGFEDKALSVAAQLSVIRVILPK